MPQSTTTHIIDDQDDYTIKMMIHYREFGRSYPSQLNEGEEKSIERSLGVIKHRAQHLFSVLCHVLVLKTTTV